MGEQPTAHAEGLRAAAMWVAEWYRQWAATSDRRPMIAIDGASGSGKSTLTDLIEAAVPGSGRVLTDSFHIPLAAAYRLRPGTGDIGAMIDQVRLAREVIAPLRAGGAATFTWTSLFDDTYSVDHSIDPPAAVVIEGTFCCRPELAARYDLRVLVIADVEVRRRRRQERDRELGGAWMDYVERVWVPDEDRHLAEASETVFDLVVSNEA